LKSLPKLVITCVIVVLLLRKFGPQLREQRMQRMAEMCDRLPENFPPIRAIRDLAEIRRTNERIVELLEQRS